MHLHFYCVTVQILLQMKMKMAIKHRYNPTNRLLKSLGISFNPKRGNYSLRTAMRSNLFLTNFWFLHLVAIIFVIPIVSSPNPFVFNGFKRQIVRVCSCFLIFKGYKRLLKVNGCSKWLGCELVSIIWLRSQWLILSTEYYNKE